LDNYGQVLMHLDRLPDALTSFERVLALAPDHPGALVNRATILIELGHPAEALADVEHALRLDPNDIKAWTKHGNALSVQGRYQEAVASFDRALALDPAWYDAHNNRGFCLEALGRIHEALQSYDAALAVKRDYVAALFNRGVNRLKLGDFARGWDDYEARGQARAFAHTLRIYPQSRWDGSFVDGTLLVFAEQGLGDQILFASMIPDLAGRASAVVVEVEPRLTGLFARSFPGMRVVPQIVQHFRGPVAAQLPMGSLGRILRRSIDDFPRRPQGFLVADRARGAELRRRLDDGRRLVGLSWHSRNPKFEAEKSVALGDFAVLLRLPGYRFIDLQYGDTGAERAAVEREFGVRIEHLDDIDNRNDIDGLAALITACDAVVTVSNTTAHLAGALGQDTRVLVPHGQGRMWCWLDGRDDSPWYPHVRLARQKSGQSWADLVRSVAQDFAGPRP
jgi:ADP-heptose:LPS heptosyltransferase